MALTLTLTPNPSPYPLTLTLTPNPSPSPSPSHNPNQAQLAVDVRHLTVSLGDGTLLAYRLPAPARPAPPPLTEASLGAKGGGEVQAAPAGAPTITSLAPLWRLGLGLGLGLG